MEHVFSATTPRAPRALALTALGSNARLGIRPGQRPANTEEFKRLDVAPHHRRDDSALATAGAADAPQVGSAPKRVAALPDPGPSETAPCGAPGGLKGEGG